MLRNNKHRIAIGTIFIALSLMMIGFQSKPITGKTESKSSSRKSGLIPDPFELYQSIPPFRAEGTSSDLPGSFDLSNEFPPPSDQGIYKDNVGYTVGFGLISYLEAKKREFVTFPLLHLLQQMDKRFYIRLILFTTN